MSDSGLLDAVLYVIRNPNEGLQLIDRLSELLNCTSTADTLLLKIRMGGVATHATCYSTLYRQQEAEYTDDGRLC